MNGLLLDLRHAVRSLRRQPGFLTAAVLVLALGIGANTAFFGIVNAVLLDPLPYPRPERLVGAGNRWGKFDVARGNLSAPDFVERHAASDHLEALGAFVQDDASLSNGGEPARVVAGRVTSGVFEALQMPPALGRVFGPSEDAPGSDRVVVLGHGPWRRRFGGDSGVIGRTVRVDGVERTVIGVMPKRFAFPTIEAQLWVPLALTPADIDPAQRGNDRLGAIGRLRSGATLEQARAEHEAHARAVAAAASAAFRELGYGANVWPLREEVTRPYASPVLLLFGAVAFLLLVACVNIAHLMLARAASRRREIAVRAAIGAPQGRLARQMLVESLVVAALGALAGLALAAWLADVLPALRIAGLSPDQAFPLDGRVLGYATVVAALCGVLFGLAPIVQVARVPPMDAMRSAGPAALGTAGGRAWLVGLEAAVTVVLLVGAGLMFQSLLRLGAVEPGFDPDGVLTVRTSLPAAGAADSALQARFYDALVERVAALPGVRAAGAVSMLPFGGDNAALAYRVEGAPADAPRRSAQFRTVTGDYFHAVGIPLRRGGTFSAAGRTGGAYEIVIDETLARQAFPKADPVGRRLVWGGLEPMTVVGVVSAIHDQGLDTAPAATLYMPHWVHPRPSLALAVRAAGDAVALAPMVRAVVRGLEADVPVYDVVSLRGLVGRSLVAPRTRALLFGLIAALALVLATVGVYGVTAYTVSRRTAEIGLRMALGASPRQVLARVLGDGLRPVLLGSAAGVAAALVFGRLVASQLYGVRPTDPATLATLPLVLVSVAAIATLVPARRAARVEPMTALREE